MQPGKSKLATFECSNSHGKPTNLLKFHIQLQYSLRHIYGKFQSDIPINMAITTFLLYLPTMTVCMLIMSILSKLYFMGHQ